MNHRLIDSHVHIWDPTVLEYSWLEGELDRPYLPAEYQAEAPATTGVIFVEAGPTGKADEVAWAESLGWPELLGVVAHASLERGSAVVSELAALRDAGRTVGIRRLLQDEPLSFFEDPGLLEGLRALASTGLPFDACIRHHQLSALTALLENVPELPVVLDHLAKPPVATGDDGTWERDLRALAALPQVSVKLSGMPPELGDDQELVSAARPWLEVALDAFGADRAMVGSDWPVSSMLPRRLAPGRWLSMVLDELAASPAEREQLSWRTASRFYGV
ncbi:MAG: amidohydrolase family protein [Pseudolysinimonas sp.]|uniref:amidohydrolase family protein n=1 Tax=Pseudolysinimonas sp. TaxID=2680009 RepID=UPI003265A4BF